jgi:undecaprenyl-diphosphatase
MMMWADILLVADGFLQTIESADKQLLLAVNGSDSLYLDRLVLILTHGATWIPLYLSLFYLVLNNNPNVRKVLNVLVTVGIIYLLAGGLDDVIVKDLVARWRPSHDPEIGMKVDIVDGYRSYKYGFFSAHAANTFSVAILFYWLVRSRLLSVTLIFWSFLNCWTRMYLGLHFPGDILAGLIWGGTVASLVYYFYHRLTRKSNPAKRLVSSKYTVTGYMRSDCDLPVEVFVFTLLFALILACFI